MIARPHGPAPSLKIAREEQRVGSTLTVMILTVDIVARAASCHASLSGVAVPPVTATLVGQ